MNPDKTARINFASESPWEGVVGYSRAVRCGNYVWIAGTTGTVPDGRSAGYTVYEQACAALERIKTALEKVGAEMADVVRTRIYLTYIADWKEAGRAHFDYFGDALPVSTIIEVNSLIGDGLLIEIEADAFIE